MKTRTTIILAVIAIAMGAYIYFHERHTLSQSEVEERSTHLLKRFVRARLSTITVERNGQRWTLERIPGADEAVDLHVWRVAAPVRDAADDEAVNALLGSLEWADPRRTLVNVGARERQSYGLDDPRVRATLQVANEQIRIALGNEVEGGQGVYASIGEPSTAYIVGKDFFEALDFDIDHFRSKVLFDGRSAAGAVRVSVRHGDSSFVLDRPDGHRWWVREPSVGYASGAAIDSMLNVFDALHSQRFVAEDVNGLARYGLAPANLDVIATMGASDGGTARSMRIRAGNVCEGHPDEVYAVIDEQAPVVCVTASELEALRITENAAFEQHLVLTQDDAVERIDVARDGHRLTIARSDEGWKYNTDSGTRAAADEASVARYMAELRRVSRVAASAAEATSMPLSLPASPENLRAHRLDTPRATITITKTDGAGTEVVHLGDSDESGSWVRRGDEPLLLRMQGRLDGLFEASALHVRPLRVITEDDARLQRFTIIQGASRETVEAMGGRFMVTEPVSVVAERALVAAFARRLATLSAERFVSSAPDTTTTSGGPRYTVEVAFGTATPGETHTHTLRVYREVEGGAEAQLDDDATVFVISEDLLVDLSAHFAKRDLLVSEVNDIASVSIVAGRLRLELPASDTTRAGPVYRALSMLHASSVVEYGTDIGATRATVLIHRSAEAGAPRTVLLSIGAEEGTGETATTRVRRNDFNVVFSVPSANLTAFFDGTGVSRPARTGE